MRTAFISDIHANREALEVVLADIDTQNVDRIVCLGDVVGYGPEPNECVAMVKERCMATVIGNHDYAALGRMDTLGFNEYARAAADWTAKALNQESIDFLESLPLSYMLDDVLLVHSSPKDPERWTYVLSYQEAQRQFGAFSAGLCYIGHSHLPVVIELNNDKINALEFTEDVPMRLHQDRRYLVNVGSVGQPRDRDPRTGYAIHDEKTDTVLLRRLEYPLALVQEKIIEAGLAPFLAQRLGDGV